MERRRRELASGVKSSNGGDPKEVSISSFQQYNYLEILYTKVGAPKKNCESFLMFFVIP
jgi:hypothetical protein